MELYHGSHRNTSGLVIHEGLCLTDWMEVAETYAGRRGETYVVEVDMGALTVVQCEGYDHDENACPADDKSFRARRATEGADVLRYEDEDEMGRVHDCYRLVSQRALDAVRITSLT